MSSKVVTYLLWKCCSRTGDCENIPKGTPVPMMHPDTTIFKVPDLHFEMGYKSVLILLLHKFV
jgi:hypothetical protein